MGDKGWFGKEFLGIPLLGGVGDARYGIFCSGGSLDVQSAHFEGNFLFVNGTPARNTFKPNHQFEGAAFCNFLLLCSTSRRSTAFCLSSVEMTTVCCPLFLSGNSSRDISPPCFPGHFSDLFLGCPGPKAQPGRLDASPTQRCPSLVIPRLRSPRCNHQVDRNSCPVSTCRRRATLGPVIQKVDGGWFARFGFLPMVMLVSPSE